MSTKIIPPSKVVAWKPQDAVLNHPRRIEGEVTRMKWIESDNEYGARRIIQAIIQPFESDVAWQVRTYATVLESQWLEAKPMIGETVVVEYYGLQEHSDPKRKPYHSYTVDVPARPNAFSYGDAAPATPSRDVASPELPAAPYIPDDEKPEEGIDDIPF